MKKKKVHEDLTVKTGRKWKYVNMLGNLGRCATIGDGKYNGSMGTGFYKV